MRNSAYSIFDTKSLVYSNPFYALTHGAAIRIVTDAARDPNSQLSRHPADFVLYCVGVYDDQNGIFSPLDPKEHIVDIVALLRLDEQPNLFSQETK